MSLFKRIKRIGVGKSLVKIKEVNDITLKNGSSRVTLKLEREKDGATGTFFIVPDSFIIEKLLDVIFKDDYRDTTIKLISENLEYELLRDFYLELASKLF